MGDGAKRPDLIRIAVVGAAIYFTIAAIGSCTPRDDTDPPGGRSNMRLYRDHLTGCEYLSPGVFGGLTPRLSANGRHICRKEPTP